MLSLDILHLIHNKTAQNKYILTHTFRYKTDIFKKNILDLIVLLNSLSLLYVYLVNYSLLKQKILMTTTYTQQLNTLKYISCLSSNYYISSTLTSGLFTNWKVLKKQILLYKWLDYFFFINLTLKKKKGTILTLYNTLYILYLKLKLKYTGIKEVNLIPKTILFLNKINTTFLKEAITLNKNIILINTKKINSSLASIQLITKNTNYYTLKFILNIITTAILHGTLI